MAFAPWAAALAGFRLVRERPLTVAVWAAAIFLARLAGMVVTTAISGRYMPALDAAMNAKTVNVDAVAAAYHNVAPGYLAGAALALPAFAVVMAAIFRAYMRREQGKGFFLRLGRAEAAMLALIVVLNLMIMFGLSFGAALIATAASLIAQADAAGGALAEGLGLTLLAGAALLGLARLSLAWPMSFQAGRPILLRAWGATRGRGWALLGAFAMAEALMIVVGVLLFSIAGGLAGALLVAMGGALEDLPDVLRAPTAVIEVFRPAPLLFSLGEALLLTLGFATVQGVAVSAYNSFAPRGLETRP